VKIVCAWMYAIGRYGFPPSLDNIFRALREMRGMGFRYIEAEGIGYENLAQVVGHRRQIRDLCRGEGLELANFAVLLPEIISLERERREKAFEQFERGVETARYLGSPYVWIDSYFPPLELKQGVRSTEELVYGQQLRVRVPEGFEWPGFWRSFVESVGRAAEIAGRYQLGLLLEPRVGEVVTNSDAMLRLAEQVGSESLGFILDIAHQHAQKELIPLAIEKLGKALRYVHVADNDGRDNRHLEPGRGTVDWDEVFRLLKHRGFQGYFSIDLEKLPDLEQKFRSAREFLEEQAKRYGL
jgi:sugar phosphate isomerase/epimerase